jgi:hypothetical protein
MKEFLLQKLNEIEQSNNEINLYKKMEDKVLKEFKKENFKVAQRYSSEIKNFLYIKLNTGFWKGFCFIKNRH